MRSRRTLDALKLAMRDSYWSLLLEQGRTAESIADQFGVDLKYVRRRASLAQAEHARATAEADAEDAQAARNRLNGTRPDGDPPRGPRPWWLELVPLFPIGAFTPASECPHRGPIRPGSYLCCMVCHNSGMEHHPAIARDASATAHLSAAPKAAPKRAGPPRASRATPKVPVLSRSDETRRERRRRTFGDRPAPV